MNLRKLLVEFIGTFFLTLTVCLTAYAKVSADLQPLAIGLIYAAMIYAGGYLSGALFNPAVTLAVFLRNKITAKEAGFYTLVQLAAGVVAAFSTILLTSAKPPMQPILETPQYFAIVPALAAELLGTFGLVWVVLNVAASKAVEGNNYYGLAIGLTLSGVMYALGGVSGGAFNPAVAVAADVAQLGSWANIWLYIVGSLGGAAAAAAAHRFVNPEG